MVINKGSQIQTNAEMPTYSCCMLMTSSSSTSGTNSLDSAVTMSIVLGGIDAANPLSR
jgi:hypothetical protein